MTKSELTPEMAELLNTARSLSPDLVRQVADFAEFLGKKQEGKLPMGPYGPIDESEVWSEEDLRDWARSGSERLDDIPPAVAKPVEQQRFLDL